MAKSPFFLTLFMSSVLAASAWSIGNLDSVLVEKRQTNDPSYQCHANCGYTIQGSRQPDYCTNSTWVGYYNGCMDCAIEFDIWEDYGDSVTAAAQPCGLSAQPVGLSSNATASAAASVTASQSSAAATASASANEASASATNEPTNTAITASTASVSGAASATASATGSSSKGSTNALSIAHVVAVVGLIALYRSWDSLL